MEQPQGPWDQAPITNFTYTKSELNTYLHFIPKYSADHPHWRQAQWGASMATSGAAQIWEQAKQMSTSSLMEQRDWPNYPNNTDCYCPVAELPRGKAAYCACIELHTSLLNKHETDCVDCTYWWCNKHTIYRNTKKQLLMFAISGVELLKRLDHKLSNNCYILID